MSQLKLIIVGFLCLLNISSSFAQEKITCASAFIENDELRVLWYVTPFQNRLPVQLVQSTEQSLVSVFPNPNNGRFALVFGNVEFPFEPQVVFLIDRLGRIVDQKTCTIINNRIDLEFTAVPPGIYSLIIQGDNSQKIPVKMIIE